MKRDPRLFPESGDALRLPHGGTRTVLWTRPFLIRFRDASADGTDLHESYARRADWPRMNRHATLIEAAS